MRFTSVAVGLLSLAATTTAKEIAQDEARAAGMATPFRPPSPSIYSTLYGMNTY